MSVFLISINYTCFWNKYDNKNFLVILNTKESALKRSTVHYAGNALQSLMPPCNFLPIGKQEINYSILYPAFFLSSDAAER